jgi:hypothetical protein
MCFFFIFVFRWGLQPGRPPPHPQPLGCVTPQPPHSPDDHGVIVREFYDIMLTDLRMTLLQGQIRVTAAVGFESRDAVSINRIVSILSRVQVAERVTRVVRAVARNN